MKPWTLLYFALVALSIALIAVPPFDGLAVARMAPTLVLVGVALRETRARFGTTIAAGLFFGAWGDYFLNTFDPNFGVWGLIAFLIGHLFYIAGLRHSGLDATSSRRRIVAALVAITAIYAMYIVWRNPLQPVTRLLPFGPHGPEQMLPVSPAIVLYAAVLVAMTAVAVLRRGSRLIAIGALVFVVSDALIPLNIFLLPKAHPGDVYATTALMYPGFLTYYLAQFLIALGACSESSPR